MIYPLFYFYDQLFYIINIIYVLFILKFCTIKCNNCTIVDSIVILNMLVKIKWY